MRKQTFNWIPKAGMCYCLHCTPQNAAGTPFTSEPLYIYKCITIP